MSTVILDTIKNRSSVRGYTAEEVTRGQVDALVMAALEAPSARNAQPWRFVVVEDRGLLRELEADAIAYFSEHGDDMTKERIKGKDACLFYHAPLVIFIAIDDGEMSRYDCGIAAENICVAAKGLGLGTVIVAMARVLFAEDNPNKDKWTRRLGFAEGFSFGLSVAVGHPDAAFFPHEPDVSKVSYIR